MNAVPVCGVPETVSAGTAKAGWAAMAPAAAIASVVPRAARRVPRTIDGFVSKFMFSPLLTAASAAWNDWVGRVNRRN